MARQYVAVWYRVAGDEVGRYVRSAKSAQSARIEWRVWYVTMRDRRRRSEERAAGWGGGERGGWASEERREEREESRAGG